MKNDISRLCHEYQVYNDLDLIHKLVYNHEYFSDIIYISNTLYVKKDFYVTLKDNYPKLKIILLLHRVNRKGFGNINLEMIDNNNINISFIKNPI